MSSSQTTPASRSRFSVWFTRRRKAVRSDLAAREYPYPGKSRKYTNVDCRGAACCAPTTAGPGIANTLRARVFPGVPDVFAMRRPTSALSRLDLPALARPTNATSRSGGSSTTSARGNEPRNIRSTGSVRLLSSGAGAALDALLGDRPEGFLLDREAHVLQLEQLLVLLHQGVLRLDQDPHQ